MNGAARYDVKARAGWSRTRRDGSSYDRDTDVLSAQAEDFVAMLYGVEANHDALLSGDPGYDFIINGLRIDVIHAGRDRSGAPRKAKGSNIIVNVGHLKLTNSDVLVYVEGDTDSFHVFGAVRTSDFRAHAALRDFGYGQKLGLSAHSPFVRPLTEIVDAA